MLLAQLKTDHEYRSPEGTAKQTAGSASPWIIRSL